MQINLKNLVHALITGEHEICRLCFGDLKEGVLYLIDDVVIECDVAGKTVLPLFEILAYVTQTSVDCHSGLPESVCLRCANAAINSYIFVKIVEQSKRKWSEVQDVINQSYELCSRNTDTIKTMFVFVNKSETKAVLDKGHDIKTKTEAVKRAKAILLKQRNSSLREMKRLAKSLQNRNFMCEDCGKTFSTEKFLIRHSQLHKKDNRCKVCDKHFDCTSSLNLHITRMHGEKKFQCNKCPKMFSSESILTAHLKEYHTCGECKICNKTMSRHSLRKHEHGHNIALPCTKCKKTFKSKDNLRIHRMKCVDGMRTEYKCDYDNCSKAYSSKGTLIQHVRYAHGNAYQCPICGKKYMDKNKLDWHIADHTGDKKFKCDICQAYFRHPNTLTYHMRSRHTGERPFACDECDDKFITSFRRTEHKRRRHGAPAPECNICKSRFTTLGRLRKHIKKHDMMEFGMEENVGYKIDYMEVVDKMVVKSEFILDTEQ